VGFVQRTAPDPVTGATLALEGNVLQPVVMGRALRLHPVVILLAVSAGGLQAGVAPAPAEVAT